MKAISLKQPWANLIAAGKKTIETRTWNTRYRGPVLIVASKSKVKDRRGKIIEPMGCSVAIARIVECRPMRVSDRRRACIAKYPGAKAWILRGIKRVPHVPIHGQLGIYNARLSLKLRRAVAVYCRRYPAMKTSSRVGVRSPG